VQREEDAVFDLLGEVVLERAGQPVGLVPRVAEHVGEEALDDAMAADGRHRGAPTLLGELDTVIGPVGHELALGEALHRHRHRPRRHPEGVGQGAGLRLAAVAGQSVDRFQRLALGARDRRLFGFDGPKPTFQSARDVNPLTCAGWA
jgi:hypothetical protein